MPLIAELIRSALALCHFGGIGREITRAKQQSMHIYTFVKKNGYVTMVGGKCTSDELAKRVETEYLADGYEVADVGEYTRQEILRPRSQAEIDAVSSNPEIGMSVDVQLPS